MRNLILHFFILTYGFSVQAEMLSLSSFLQKISQENSAVDSQRLNEEASRLGAKEGDLLTAVNLYSMLEHTVDMRETSNPSLEGKERNQSIYQLGLEQQSILGISHKLFFASDTLSLRGADPSFISAPETTKSSFNYEFNLPMWRNGFGRTTESQVESIKEQKNSESFAARFARKQAKASGTAIYWRLKVAQEQSKLLLEILEGSESFLKWTKGRVRDRLGEQTDLKQAEAAVSLRRYELETATAELLEAAQAFNEALQLPADSLVPDLDPLPKAIPIFAPSSIKDEIQREDVQSLEALLNAQKAQARITSEATRPLIDFSGRLSTSGFDARTGPSFNESLSADYPSYTVGLKISIPLDRSSVHSVQKSADMKIASLNAQLERKRYEVLAEFEKLNRNYSQSLKILELAKTLEIAQYEKYKTETSRRRTGRTSTFQLLSFQQEYLQSRQSLLRAQSAVLQLSAQLLLFDKKNEAYL